MEQNTMSKTKHGVYLKYGQTEIKLTVSDLRLIADALEIIDPVDEKDDAHACKLLASFLALLEYQKSVRRG